MSAAVENDAGLRFRVETACDGYANLWDADVPDDVLSPEDYLRGAHDAAEAIRTAATSSEHTDKNAPWKAFDRDDHAVGHPSGYDCHGEAITPPREVCGHVFPPAKPDGGAA